MSETPEVTPVNEWTVPNQDKLERVVDARLTKNSESESSEANSAEPVTSNDESDEARAAEPVSPNRESEVADASPAPTNDSVEEKTEESNS